MHAREATQQTACERLLYAQPGASGAGPGVEAMDPLRWSNPREIPAALGPVRPGSVSRARLLWMAAALLLEAIATDMPGDPDASVLPLEHGLGLIEPLTNSETRVLHYLPTYMGVPEIAATLYLSANTVKTHVRHLYRKLGVHSRQEAVRRARALGLLAAKASPDQRSTPEHGDGGMDHVIRAR